ncbi:MAG: alanyl-tRNA editing protein [Alphaproteobacteria bacterium]
MTENTLELFREDAYARETIARVVERGDAGVVLDRTVFYPMAGGQPGDRGELRLADETVVPVVDTRSDEAGRIVHIVAPEAARPVAGDEVTAAIDWPRRHRLMRVHSCLHLLCRAVDEPVTGGQIGEDRGRLDFALQGEVPAKEVLTERLTAWIAQDLAISHRWVAAAELDANPELVRTMSVKPPRTGGKVRLVEIEGVDLQACGGTHVARTGEIGRVEVTKSESKGKQNRRFTVALVDG